MKPSGGKTVIRYKIERNSMRIALGVALFALICCVGCGSSAPDLCQVLMDQAKERNQRYGDFVGNLGKQVKTLGAHAVAKAILQESFATRAWFLACGFRGITISVPN